MTKKPFPTQARLHELLERHYDSDGRLYFVAKVKRGTKVKVGDVLYGCSTVYQKGKPSEHTRFQLSIDGHPKTMAMWNYIYEYGDYDRDLYTVDHIDRNPSNDHHINLRILTRSEQNKNRDGYKKTGASSNYRGVHFDKKAQKWCSRYYDENCKQKYIGYYLDELEAAHAYDEASWRVYKDLGKLNFPENYMN